LENTDRSGDFDLAIGEGVTSDHDAVTGLQNQPVEVTLKPSTLRCRLDGAYFSIKLPAGKSETSLLTAQRFEWDLEIDAEQDRYTGNCFLEPEMACRAR
jgi:hypothetical protein